ncbi:hypothetical protein ACRAWF_26590 [Streptomyces sp. L7]
MDIAGRVADKLVDNAVQHGKPVADGRIHLRLIVTADTHRLLVEVDDAYPEFPGFETVADQSGEPVGKPTGLWWVAHYRGALVVGREAGHRRQRRGQDRAGHPPRRLIPTCRSATPPNRLRGPDAFPPSRCSPGQPPPQTRPPLTD